MDGHSLTFESLLESHSKELSDFNIADLNLAAAHGLPGIVHLNTDTYIEDLYEWSRRVQFEICRHLYQLDSQADQGPTEFTYGNSLARFICWYMLQVLQEDCGVKYNPERKFDPDFCQPEDLFIHGIVDEKGYGGTCASMPVVYVAIGQLLGLPVSLVETRGHLFFRWDDPKGTTLQWKNPYLTLWIPPDRFNIEGSGEGIAYYPDSHYIQWPEVWKEVDFQHGRYLRSMTHRDALAAFLVQRSECFFELQNWHECLKAIFFARKLAPADARYEWLHAERTKQFADYQHSQQILQELTSHARQVGVKNQTMKHGNHCQCYRREDREKAKEPVGMPGHAEHCLCSGCLQSRTQAKIGAPLGHSAFQIPGPTPSPFPPQLPGMTHF
ncbi:hypothetical protein [Thalassoglobus sp.]|uniref:hypothetical protein n=1 Tax=Thalassoglobus sp. TaxID=2795869 RepID=UPI003AA7CFC4